MKTRVILIDAFKPEYLQYAPYLRSLSEKNQWGDLNMGIGHWRGVDVLFNGKSEIIANFCKDRNRLRYLRYFTFLDSFGKTGRFIVDVLFNLPRLFRGYEIFKTGKIPVKMLCKLDVSYGKHVAKNHDIDFVYFGELDELGHRYGTNSFEIIKAVREIDKKVSLMRFDLIFSDHGMVNVEKIVRVPITEDCFIDSDMARYWGSEDEMKRIKDKLPMEHGKIIEWNKKYGDLIFLVNTGVLIFPDFWNEKIVRGMHGYDGQHKDMKAFYLLNKNGSREDLKVEELHEVLNEIRKGK
tara:strand:+ start:403 stop:1287 length:885 start_codon:yes stop_codon:yes gene_type:complete